MPRKPPVAPTCFVPTCPADFVGQAGKVAEVLMRKAERMRTNPDQPLKLLVSGAPGIGSLTERFQTRFLPVRLQPPENEVLAQFLARRWAVPIATTRLIAAGAAGNVRAAMADLEMWMG